MVEENWIAISLDGGIVKKINLPFFYRLGAVLKPLTEMEVKVSTRLDIVIASFPLPTTVRDLLDLFPTLIVCRGTGTEFISAITDVVDWFRQTPGGEWDKQDSLVDSKFRRLIDKAREFQTVLAAEIQTLETYHAAQKGNYDTTSLIERAENILPESLRNRISSKVVEEIRHSGRCLVFDNSTASGFHILRAVELVMHEYYVIVCKPKPKPDKRLDNWGAYLAELQKSTDPDVQRVIAILRQIKDQDRNVIMHPDEVLSPDEAFILFEIAKGAIIAMASKLPVVKKKGTGSSKGTAK